MHEEISVVMDEVRHLRWRLDQVERDRDEYRALWEEERAEHRLTKKRMAQAMDEAYNNGYQSGRIQGAEAKESQVQDLVTRCMRCEELLNSISCLVAEGPEFMGSGDIYHQVGQEAGQAMRILRGKE
jgi:flagellar biosynthesis/type III secretory pathway protein FliH